MRNNGFILSAIVATIVLAAQSGFAEQLETANTDYLDDPLVARQVHVPTSGGLSEAWTERLYDADAVWAYRPIENPEVPETEGPQPQHPVDAFIQRRWEQEMGGPVGNLSYERQLGNASYALQPAGLADRRTIIYRLTYGITGLPPTPQQIEAFENDRSADAYERLVERLMASPRYGEQWARQWLDVVRYADTAGGSNDFERPNAWRYRDYVIRAFNDDKPFDQFVIEQIAGDELDETDPEKLVATGFLRMGPWEHTGMSVAAETRQQFLDDITNTVGVSFLGQALNCAACHDHKTDPVPTRDYYRIQAVFAPVQMAERKAPFLPEEQISGAAEDRQRIQNVLEQTRHQQEKLNRKSRQAQRQWLRERGYDPDEVDIRQLPEQERPPRPADIGLDDEDLGVQALLHRRVLYFQRTLTRYDPLALSVYNGPTRTYNSIGAPHDMPGDRSSEIDDVYILAGGSIGSPGQRVSPGVLSAMPNAHRHAIPETRDGRRLAFARWIVSPDNTLTARVISNRVWQRHFGRGIVATANNFGSMGERPTHPELLDYLATYLMDHDWSIKALDRHILTSQTYRRHYQHEQMAMLRQIDPDNTLLAYFPPRRLTAEEIRDSMLALSGALNSQQGGPGVFPEIDLEIALQARHLMGAVGPVYQPSPRPEQRHRATIYTYRHRGLDNPLLEVFDRPSSDLTCERREETTVTPQAFALWNSQNSHDRALALAHRLMQKSDDAEQRIVAAFQLVFGRAPNANERVAAIEHVERMGEHHRQHKPARVEPPTSVVHRVPDERTGEPFEWEEPLDIYATSYEPDLKPWDVSAETRALAELCLVLINANEFLYVY